MKTKGKPAEIDKLIGERLRVRRLLLGLRQVDIAKQLNVTVQQIQKYEKGVNRISCSILYEISKIMNAPLNYFFKSQETDGQELGVDIDCNDPIYKDITKFIKIISKTPDQSKRQKMLKVIELMYNDGVGAGV